VALCLGTYGDPWGVGVSYERGTPVGVDLEIAGYGARNSFKRRAHNRLPQPPNPEPASGKELLPRNRRG